MKRKFDAIDRSELKKMQNDAIQFAEKLEQMRLYESQSIRDNDLRRRVTLAKYFVQVINPKIIAFLLSIHVNPKVFRRKYSPTRKKPFSSFSQSPHHIALSN